MCETGKFVTAILHWKQGLVCDNKIENPTISYSKVILDMSMISGSTEQPFLRTFVFTFTRFLKAFESKRTSDWLNHTVVSQRFFFFKFTKHLRKRYIGSVMS